MGGVEVGGAAVGMAGMAVGDEAGDWPPTPAIIMQVKVRRSSVFRFMLRFRRYECLCVF